MTGFKLLNKISLLVLIALMILSSCAKEDSVTILEEETPLELGFKMTVNGEDIETNAFAAYCVTDSMEFVIVSNKEANLDFEMSFEDLEVGDFVYFTMISDAVSWGFGQQVFEEGTAGFPGISVLGSDAEINIESNNGEIIVGSSEGIFLGADFEGNFTTIPYTMNFVAEIAAESDFCE